MQLLNYIHSPNVCVTNDPCLWHLVQAGGCVILNSSRDSESVSVATIYYTRRS
jgi:hypothetical protein